MFEVCEQDKAGRLPHSAIGGTASIRAGFWNADAAGPFSLSLERRNHNRKSRVNQSDDSIHLVSLKMMVISFTSQMKLSVL